MRTELNIVSIILLFLFGCNENTNEEIIANEKVKMFNPKLENAARNNIKYYNHHYIVIAQNNSKVFSTTDTNNSPTRLFNRGEIMEVIKNSYDFLKISVPETHTYYYIPKNNTFFEQYKEGMRFPVIGIVNKKDTYIEIFNHGKKQYENHQLDIGTSFYWVIKKDGNYINVLNSKTGKPLTGRYSEPNLDIVQLNEHKKLMSKYKSDFNLLFPQ